MPAEKVRGGFVCCYHLCHQEERGSQRLLSGRREGYRLSAVLACLRAMLHSSSHQGTAGIAVGWESCLCRRFWSPASRPLFSHLFSPFIFVKTKDYLSHHGVFSACVRATQGRGGLWPPSCECPSMWSLPRVLSKATPCVFTS